MEEEGREVSTAKSEPLYCDSCTKNMTDEDGSSTIAVSISVDAGVGKQVPFYQRQLGKYKLGRTYNFCWECYLDSFIVGVRRV